MASLSEKDLAVLKRFKDELAKEEVEQEAAEDVSDVIRLDPESRNICERFLEQPGTSIYRNWGLWGLYATRSIPVKFAQTDREGKEIGERRDAEIQVVLAQRSAYHHREFTIKTYVHGIGMLPDSLVLTEGKRGPVMPVINRNGTRLREATARDMTFWKESTVDILQASLPK